MSRVVGISLLVLSILTAVGLFIPWIYKSRVEADFARCKDHLRQIASWGLLHATLPGKPLPENAREEIPPGTLLNDKLGIEERMSWYVLILGALDQGPPVEPGQPRRKPASLGDILSKIDVNESWNAQMHRPVFTHKLTVALCPGAVPRLPIDQPVVAQYVGIGGLGLDTARLSLEEAGSKAGVFRFHQPTPLQTIIDGDGASNSMAVAETNHELKPWMQGGSGTVRGLDPAVSPYVGVNAPFGGCHRGRGNFAFADGSVRTLTYRVDPAFFRSLLTIAGKEEVQGLGEP